MHPILVELGRLQIRSYGFMLAVSFLLGIWLAGRRAKRYGIDPQKILDLSVIIILAAVVGSRLLYVVFHLEQYNNPLDVSRCGRAGPRSMAASCWRCGVVLGYRGTAFFSHRGRRSRALDRAGPRLHARQVPLERVLLRQTDRPRLWARVSRQPGRKCRDGAGAGAVAITSRCIRRKSTRRSRV
jgi:hypothetical protein